MLVVDAFAFAFLRRDPTPARFAGVVVVGGGIAVASAYLGARFGPGYRSMFVALGLSAWAIFGHGLAVVLVGWWLLRGEHRTWARASAACAIVLAWIGVQAFAIEPTWLQVTRYRFETPKVVRPLTIGVLADFQTDHVGAYERRVVARLVEERPDLILLPGDYTQHPTPEGRQRLNEEVNALFRELGVRAPLGVFAVQGNCEWLGWERVFAGLDAVTFGARDPGTRTVETGELSITGLTLGDSYETDLAVEGASGLHVVVGHYPNFALGDVDADLLVAGHTHGGQVRLPGFGPPITLSRVPRSWAAGRTELEGGRTLIVSRGIGMERAGAPRLRFLCRPELVFIDVVPVER